MVGRKSEEAHFTQLKWLHYALVSAAVVLVCAIPYGIYLFVTNQRKPVDLNQSFGCESIKGVEESGFDKPEQQDGKPFRWTNGLGRLVIPIDRRKPPQALEVHLAFHNPKGTLLQLFVNNQRLLDETVSTEDLARTFDLAKINLGNEVTIKLVSGTFVPQKVSPGSTDPRNLGVLVKGIRLLMQVPAATPK